MPAATSWAPTGRRICSEDVAGYQLLALELVVSAEGERELLELEVRELEQWWREEEAIAAIADRELTVIG